MYLQQSLQIQWSWVPQMQSRGNPDKSNHPQCTRRWLQESPWTQWSQELGIQRFGSLTMLGSLSPCCHVVIFSWILAAETLEIPRWKFEPDKEWSGVQISANISSDNHCSNNIRQDLMANNRTMFVSVGDEDGPFQKLKVCATKMPNLNQKTSQLFFIQ